MAGGGSKKGNGDKDPFGGSGGTGRDNPFEVAPISVLHLEKGRSWDPSNTEGKNKLPVPYSVRDPNKRAVSGRILYYVTEVTTAPAGSEKTFHTVVHREKLGAADITHGSHELPEGRQWDGTITEGIPEFKGEKVTVDLSPILVYIEIWNHAGDPTGEASELLSRGIKRVHIDPIVNMEWDDNRCIPFDDPDEPDLGWTDMTIEVKNVRENTPVKILVARITDPDMPFAWFDETYAKTGVDSKKQPGLEGARVQGGKVLSEDGLKPFVRFCYYSKHWPYPGENNFYCFWVSFGSGKEDFQFGSEHDYRTAKPYNKKCLHMRFTVLIHRSAGDLPAYTSAANRLHSFFKNKTSFYRSYLMKGKPSNLEEWLKHFKHRYIVLVLGHGWFHCNHSTHKKNAAGHFLDTFHSGFVVDRNVCPDVMKNSKSIRKRVKKARKKVPQKKDVGCGQKSQTGCVAWLGGEYAMGNMRSDHTKKYLLTLHRPKVGPKSQLKFIAKGAVPRFCFFSGGCRSITTTNFAEHFVDNGTRYYSGWEYSPACDYGVFCYSVFRRWIKGTRSDPAKVEYDVTRFAPAYVAEAARKIRPRYHPRLTDRSQKLSRRGPHADREALDPGGAAVR